MLTLIDLCSRAGWAGPNVGDGKCVICDSYVHPTTLVRICDECNYGSLQGKCIQCGGKGISDAYYCKECTISEKDVRVRPAPDAGVADKQRNDRC